MIRQRNLSCFSACILAFFLLTVFSKEDSVAQAQPKRSIAITFDDLPVACMCETIGSRQELTDKLMATFKKFSIPEGPDRVLIFKKR